MFHLNTLLQNSKINEWDNFVVKEQDKPQNPRNIGMKGEDELEYSAVVKHSASRLRPQLQQPLCLKEFQEQFSLKVTNVTVQTVNQGTVTWREIQNYKS